MKRRPTSRPLDHPAPLLRKGGDNKEVGRRGVIFGYPTESFYALGVKATDKYAIKKLFRLKHREAGKPIALIAADLKQVKKFFYMTKDEERLARKHWPGALTILLKPKPPSSPRPSPGGRGWIAADALVPSSPNASTTSPRPLLNQGVVRGGRIGVRVPTHAGARQLAHQAGSPITATSANISGQPPTKSARKVKRDFPGIMIAPGRCGRNAKPSTVVKIIKNSITIIRQGATHPIRSLQKRRLS